MGIYEQMGLEMALEWRDFVLYSNVFLRDSSKSSDRQ